METTEFSVGDMVEWISQANGSFFIKAGHVVAVVPPKTQVYKILEREKSLEQYNWSAIDMRSGSRFDTSYLIAVQTKTRGGKVRNIKKLYWPRVGLLKKARPHGVD